MLYCSCFQNTRSHYAVLYLFSEHQIVGQNIVPSNTKYLGEVRISSEENLAIFPCEMLAEISGQNVLEVCFRYVTSSIVGTTYSPVSLCLPATMKGMKLRFDNLRTNLANTISIGSFLNTTNGKNGTHKSFYVT